jgi:hypothetical protein
MYTKDVYDIEMDNRTDNFTVMDESSWVINNNQYKIYKLAEAEKLE